VQIRPKSFISRSAVLEHFTCPYKHYLTYWAAGTGFHPTKQSLDLLIGSVVHRGLQHLFEHCRLHKDDEVLTNACIDEAVGKADELWKKELGKKSLALKSSEEYNRLDWILGEQECLWEGLIRAFGIYKLPAILDEMEILEVEKEEVFSDFSPLVTFLGKADGLFRRKRDVAIIVLSIKTASEFADVTSRNILHDMQGVSETFLVQERLERAWKKFNELSTEGITLSEKDVEFVNRYWWMVGYESPPKVYAVQYEFLIKGQRKQEPYKSGIYQQQNFLCHPYKMDSVRQIFIGSQRKSSINPAQYKWNWGAGKQPKGWEKTDIWNDIGINAWITMLSTGQVQAECGNPFEKILHTPDLIVRSEGELKEWLVSTRHLADNIRMKVDLLKSAMEYGESEEVLEEMIWKFFPKNTQSCHDYYGHDCQFVSHCHEREEFEDLVNAGVFIPRIPHHDLERETLVKEGLIAPDEDDEEIATAIESENEIA